MRLHKRAANKLNLDEREALFLAFFYGDGSPTKGKLIDSALEAGFSTSTANTKAPRILRKYEDCSFRASAKAVGITKPYLAMKLKQIMDSGGQKEILAGIRLTLANFGETTDQSNAGGNTFNAPVMMIVGASPERIDALRNSTPQLSRERLEQLSNARSARKLELLKAGKLPPLKRIADGSPSRRNGEIIDAIVDAEEADIPDTPGSGLDGGDQEVESQPG